MTGPPAGAEQTARADGAVRLVVLGGSAPATVQLIDALATGPRELHGIDLVLHGRSAGRLAAVARAAGLRADALGLAMRVTAQEDRAAALAGADVVLNQIRPGGLEQRSADESFPHGFGLPGEETLGPGGFASAIRSVAALRPIWADVARCCPGALLINLTNPAGIVTQAARHEFGLEVIAVCDSPLDLLASAARRLGRQDAAALMLRYVGMNHVGWYVPTSPSELDRLVGLVPGIDQDSAAAARRAARPLPALLRTSRPDARGPARPADESGPAARAGQRDPGHLRAGRDPRHVAASGAVVLARGHAGDRRLAARLGVAAHSRPAEPGPGPLAGRRRDRRGPRDHRRPRPGRAAAGRGAARPAARDPGAGTRPTNDSRRPHWRAARRPTKTWSRSCSPIRW